MDGYFKMLYSKIFMFATFFIFVSTYNRIIAAPSPFVLKLIHPGKFFTPNHDPNATFYQQVQRVADSSMARYAYLTKDLQNSKVDIIQPRLKGELFGFQVNISIGDPPISQMVLMDTGSDLTWVQCLPCIHCFPQPNPFYDPSKSSSFSSVNYYSSDCEFHQYAPGKNNTCVYRVRYVGNDTTRGEIGKEKFTFTTSDGGLIAIPNLLFGCGQENYARYLRNGIMGLSANSISSVAQLGSKFSYCIGDVNDPDYKFNILVLGEGAIFEDDTTPLEIGANGKYYLTLESISFGNKKLNVDPNVFRRSSNGRGGVIIDSGTFYTFLARSAYYALYEEVEDWNFGRLQKLDPRSTFLCYEGVMTRDLDDFPEVTFQFAAGASVALGHRSIFYQLKSNAFCLAFSPVEDYDLNIIGLVFQQYANVGYDIEKRTLSFSATDCEALIS